MNPFGAALLGRNAAELQAGVANPPGVVAHTGRVTSNALAATLRQKGPSEAAGGGLADSGGRFPAGGAPTTVSGRQGSPLSGGRLAGSWEPAAALGLGKRQKAAPPRPVHCQALVCVPC